MSGGRKVKQRPCKQSTAYTCTAEAGGPIETVGERAEEKPQTAVPRMAFYFDHYFQIWTSEAPKSLFLFPNCIPSVQETEENNFYQVLYIFGECSISFPFFLISFPPHSVQGFLP